jgi:hypothetical protein
MNIVIMHNCQTAELGLALKELFPRSKILYHPLPAGDAAPGPEFVDLLRQAMQVIDVLITNNRGADLIRANQLQPRPGMQTILVPPIEFHAFHPDLCYIRNKTTGQLVTHNYNSAIAVWAYMHSYDPRDTVRLFTKANFARLGYLSAWKPSYEHMKLQFTACGLDFNAFYLHVKRHGVFMHSTNHPKSLCIVRLAKLVAMKMGCSATVLAKEITIPDLLGQTIWPVYPEIAEHLSLVEYADYWKFDGKLYIDSLDAYVEHAFTHYQSSGLQPDDIEYVSRDRTFLSSVLATGGAA